MTVVSALQKHIRRGMEKEAMECACELAHTSKNFMSMLCKRLEIMSHEDIGLADPQAILLVRTSTQQAKEWWNPELAKIGNARMAIGTAVRVLCRANKSREGDHFHTVVGLANLLEIKVPNIPDYALDQHTSHGRRMGRGVEFFRTESTKLVPAPTEPDIYEDEAYRLWELQAKVGKPEGRARASAAAANPANDPDEEPAA